MKRHLDQLRYKAIVNVRDRRFWAARFLFEKLVAISDNTHDYLWRALTAAATGDLAGAVADYETVLSRDPNQRSALYGCALFLATAPQDEFRDGPRALELATRALATIERDNWRLLLVLAAAHAECGEFSRADEIAREALKSAPDRLRERICERIEKYRLGEPFRLTPERFAADIELDLDSMECAQCGAPTFFGRVESNGSRTYLCLSCYQCDIADRNQSPD